MILPILRLAVRKTYDGFKFQVVRGTREETANPPSI
jgi:hypothetical protein